MNENLDKLLKEYYKSDITIPEGLNDKVYHKIVELDNKKSKINLFINVSFITLNVTLCLLLNVFVGAVIIKLFMYIYLMSCIVGCCLISYANSKLIKKENDYRTESMVL